MCDDVNKHLHLVLHTVGIILEQLIAVFHIDAHIDKVFIKALWIRNPILVNIQEELQKLSAGHKLRYCRGGEDISDILRYHIPYTIICFHIESACISFNIAVQTVKQRSFTGTVSTQQSIDLAGLKSKVNITKKKLFDKCSMINSISISSPGFTNF